MKKGFLKGIALVLATVSLSCVTACGGAESSSDENAVEKVFLKAITGADAVGVMEADYFLLAQPAVGAQSKKGFTVKGDLQTLYDEEKGGYPQAVLVGKKEIVENYAEWTAGFVASVRDAGAWLETASGEVIVSAVSSHMEDEGTATSLKAPLLTADAVAGCGVRFAYASEYKTQISDFLAGMIAVNENSAKMPSDAFYWTGNSQTPTGGSMDKTVRVYMPDGAPALALAGLMANDTEEDGIEYNVVSASLIASKVTNKDEDKNADFCVLPITAGSKLLGTGDRYKALGVVTQGNLYLIAKDGETITAENISSLKGKTIGVLNINEVPGLTLKAVLNKYNIPFEEIRNDG